MENTNRKGLVGKPQTFQNKFFNEIRITRHKICFEKCWAKPVCNWYSEISLM
jgi:hypothetical protein